MRNTICRTFSTPIATCVIYNNGNLSECEVTLPASCTISTGAEKYIRKNPNVIAGKLVEVKSIRVDTVLYGMDEQTFIAHAKPYNARGKDTRLLITKTVKGFIGDYVYMSTDTRELLTREVSVPADMANKLDKYAKSIELGNEKAILIENLKPIEALYGMTEAEFKHYAKRMVDHQHFAE